jgi:hypothetical protein
MPRNLLNSGVTHMARFQFDSFSVAPQAPMGVIPAGTYTAHITESDVVELKSGNGKGLKLTFEVIDGQFKGRKVWEHLNVIHTNEQAQGIAQSQLSTICRATGVTKLEDTASLHFKPIKITVAIKPASGDYKEGNSIKGYEPANGSTTPTAPATATPSAPAANAAKSSAPAWAKKSA